MMGYAILLSIVVFSMSMPLYANIFEYDRIFMKRAVELAWKASGRTYPNPCVGCVIVNEQSQIIGEGYHEKCGEPHAEVNALRNAGGIEKTQNCTAYVTLEPCNHYGRTPPCTLALIRHGIKRVVVGYIDPDSRVGGKGILCLQEHNITTEIIDREESRLCQCVNEPFFHRIHSGCAYCTTLLIPTSLKSSLLLPSKNSFSTHRLLKLKKKIQQIAEDMDSIVISSSLLNEWLSEVTVPISNLTSLNTIGAAQNSTRYSLPAASSEAKRLLMARTIVALIDKLFPSYQNIIIYHHASCEDSLMMRTQQRMSEEVKDKEDTIAKHNTIIMDWEGLFRNMTMRNITTISTRRDEEVDENTTHDWLLQIGKIHQSNGLVFLRGPSPSGHYFPPYEAQRTVSLIPE